MGYTAYCAVYYEMRKFVVGGIQAHVIADLAICLGKNYYTFDSLNLKHFNATVMDAYCAIQNQNKNVWLIIQRNWNYVYIIWA